MNDADNSTAVEAGPLTPTPGICDRTEKIQVAILTELTGVTDCEAVTVANLASIRLLGGAVGFTTFGQGITALKAVDFAGLTSLTQLQLSENELTTLPAGVFSGLAAIQEILLTDNLLSALPEEAFKGLTTLQGIHLADNNLTAVPGRAVLRSDASDHHGPEQQ